MPDWAFHVIPSHGGDPVWLTDARGLSLTMRLGPGAFSEGSFTIDCASDQAPLLKARTSDILCYRDGDLLMRGRLQPAQSPPTLDENQRVWTPTFRDYRDRYDHVFLDTTDTRSYSGDTGNIPRQILAQVNGHVGMSSTVTWVSTAAQNPGPTVGNTQAQAFQPGQSFTAAVDQLAQQTFGFEWDIDELLRLQIWATGRGAVKAAPYEFPGGKVTKVEPQDPGSTYGNAIRATGGSNALGTALPPVSLLAADLVTRAEGRWDLAASANDITSAGVLNLYAAWKLQVAQSRQVSLTCTLADGTWGGRSDLWLGDTVPLWIGESGPFNSFAPQRCFELDLTPRDDGGETVKAVFGAPRFTLKQSLTSAARRVAILERLT